LGEVQEMELHLELSGLSTALVCKEEDFRVHDQGIDRVVRLWSGGRKQVEDLKRLICKAVGSLEL